MKREKKKYTLVIVPHDQKNRMKVIKLPYSFIAAVVAIFGLVSSFLLTSFAYNVFMSGKLVNYRLTLSEIKGKENRMDYVKNETDKLKATIWEVHLRNKQLCALLGLKEDGRESKIKQTLGKDFLGKLKEDEKDIFAALDEARSLASADREKLLKLKAHITDSYKKMSAIPSRWPVNGRITSGYGYRTTPWREFHHGVDIKASYGTPIRATAPGVVAFVGWRKGYGKTIILKHAHGFATLYGHCSSLLVSRGEQVELNQPIAKIGATGRSTGTHVHYEVRKNNRKINPTAFLDLKILTAARILK
ncbi:M23 family metallopeptidase [Candidatus Margulisiibacteriota bacterium]